MTAFLITYDAPCPACGADCVWAQTPAATTSSCPCTSDPATAAAGHTASNRGTVAGSEQGGGL